MRGLPKQPLKTVLPIRSKKLFVFYSGEPQSRIGVYSRGVNTGHVSLF